MSRSKSGSASTEVPVGRTDLGRRIVARRQELGLTREQVGKRCGADAMYVAYLEEHAAAPAIGSLARIADALGTSVAELTGATTEYPPGRGTAARDAELIVLTDEECRHLLSTHGVGRVAVFTPRGPAIFPVNYVVAGNEIAFRTSGEAVLARAAGTEMAFEVDHIDDVTRQGWSVMAVGRAEGVTDAAAKQRLDAVARSLPWPGGDRTHWMKIAPIRITGRRVVHP
ncbi:pyridoxamine 5'-phosphate oxidase family protein [Streptomyces sp. NBC_00347]|uniref:helix-turn-helix domain-containing protein n=1 Tax=Streptomyces sp. NBC_00347 TaxID=2975721 RepID=UPI0022517450|nr:pyridoxamine 5'-phosphate oxidase family protein [Streptomyces sp. NBC_00347]MCX5126912.1 pyridoxamine 5'-phosphate oxidase family protein [Streptomyces sp. NBC_00347]